MPKEQLLKVIEQELGPNWRSRVRSFDEEPIAAASIGQVRCHLRPLSCKIGIQLFLVLQPLHYIEYKY